MGYAAILRIAQTFCTTTNRKSKMNLSTRAIKYLSKLERDENWITGKEETRSYLVTQKIYPSDSILDFQSNYSGLEFIDGNRGEWFKTYLFSKEQVQTNQPIEFEKIDDTYVFICGEHETAQFEFYLTAQGEFCTIDHNDALNIIHSSFDKKVEIHALQNEIKTWVENPSYFEIQDIDILESILSKEFEIISECSDKYSSWWGNENLIIELGVWLDRSDNYFHIYGKEEKVCDELIELLRMKNTLK